MMAYLFMRISMELLKYSVCDRRREGTRVGTAENGSQGRRRKICWKPTTN